MIAAVNVIVFLVTIVLGYLVGWKAGFDKTVEIINKVLDDRIMEKEGETDADN